MSKKGILLLNLGSPDSTSLKDVRKYLHQFLMDERVIDTPYLLRKFIVCCTILPSRPKATSEAYNSIWTEEGSPLIITSKNVQKLLQEKVEEVVALGMRYGNPSTEFAIKELLQQGEEDLEEILVIPLYPHYAMSSYETAVVEVRKVVRRLKRKIALKIFPPFFDNSDYIHALAESARPFLEQGFDHLLFSYHGLPERHLVKSDVTKEHCMQVDNCCFKNSKAHETCYRFQAFKTTELFVKETSIPKEKYSVAFQSRLGKDPWLKPYTDMEIERLAKEGVKKLLVICPAFVSDCLETIEEIGMAGKESFEKMGGETLQLIPCLNEHELWIKALEKWCLQS